MFSVHVQAQAIVLLSLFFPHADKLTSIPASDAQHIGF
jgi:hypothetical protein